MLRKWIAMVTGLLLLTVALLPAASAETAAPANGYEAESWKKSLDVFVKQWNLKAKITYVLYTPKQGKPYIYAPTIKVVTKTSAQTKKPAQTVTPANPTAPSQPTMPAQPTAPSTQPQTPKAPSGNGNSGTSTANPAAPSVPSSLRADEQRMVQLVNQARKEAGLQPLEVDMNLVKVARIKAQDMVANGYFSHTSPTYGSPFDMMRAFGITNWRAAAENIAQNPTVEGAHNSFMNSPGHRSNILNPSFNKVGIGIVDGGPYGKTFVQLFIQTY